MFVVFIPMESPFTVRYIPETIQKFGTAAVSPYKPQKSSPCWIPPVSASGPLLFSAAVQQSDLPASVPEISGLFILIYEK